MPQTITNAIGVLSLDNRFSANGFRWDPGGSWGVGVNLATWVLRGEVARNQTAAVRITPRRLCNNCYRKVQRRGGFDKHPRAKIAPALIRLDGWSVSCALNPAVLVRLNGFHGVVPVLSRLFPSAIGTPFGRLRRELLLVRWEPRPSLRPAR